MNQISLWLQIPRQAMNSSFEYLMDCWEPRFSQCCYCVRWIYLAQVRD